MFGLPGKAPAGGRGRGLTGSALGPGFPVGAAEPAAPALPPPPLAEERLEAIREFVRANGGIVNLGKICHDFLGVKKSQLEGSFSLARVGDQWQVGLLELGDLMATLPLQAAQPQASEAAALVAAAAAEVAAAGSAPLGAIQNATPEAAAASDVAALDATQVEAIALYLEQHGGALPLGRLTQNFRGLKRAQLETHFELSHVGVHGQWEVRLPGMESQGAEMIFQGKAVSVDTPLPPLTEEQVATVRELLASAPNQTMPFMHVAKSVPGVKRKQLEEHFEILQVDKKRFDVTLNGPPGRVDGRRARQPVGAIIRPAAVPVQLAGELAGGLGTWLNAPPSTQGVAPASVLPQQMLEPAEPPPPLTSEVVEQVAQLLESQGGQAPMGKVSQTFKFIKRQQLEGIFELQRIGDQWVVRLPGTPARPLPPPAPKPVMRPPQGIKRPLPGMPLTFQARPPLRNPAAFSALAAPMWRGAGKGMTTAMGSKFGPVGAQLGGALGALAGALQAPLQPRFPLAASLGLRPPKAASAKPEATEPPPPLAPEVLEAIQTLVEQAGGSVPMGRVSQAFMGAKRAQLQEHFELTREGDQWRVALPAAKRARLL